MLYYVHQLINTYTIQPISDDGAAIATGCTLEWVSIYKRRTGAKCSLSNDRLNQNCYFSLFLF
jgi:hypothetical protein